MHKPKVENYILFGELSKNLSQGFSLSALRDCSAETREKPGYIAFAENNNKTKKPYVVKYQKITAKHKNGHLTIMILVFFFVWEDAIVWAH